MTINDREQIPFQYIARGGLIHRRSEEGINSGNTNLGSCYIVQTEFWIEAGDSRSL